MVIYGVALLACCMLVGIIIGDLVGVSIGINANVRGVGLAMIFLVVISDILKKRDRLDGNTHKGLDFWSSMYIPIVVAMAASQNAVGALSGGGVATFTSFLLVPILSRTKHADTSP